MMKNTESINLNLADLEKQVIGFRGEIVRLESSKASMIEENSKLSDTIARQSDQYQAEFNRLNQLVDDLRMSNEQLRQTEIDLKNDALQKGISDLAISNGDVCMLLTELTKQVKTLSVNKDSPEKR